MLLNIAGESAKKMEETVRKYGFIAENSLYLTVLLYSLFIVTSVKINKRL